MNDLALLQEAASVAREDQDPRWRAVAVWLDTEALMHATVTAAADRVDRESGGRARLMVDDGGACPTSTLPQAAEVARTILAHRDQPGSWSSAGTGHPNAATLPAEDLVEPGDEVPDLCELADRVAALEERLSPPGKQGMAAPERSTPSQFRDAEGDLWERDSTPMYRLIAVGPVRTRRPSNPKSLEFVRSIYGPLTPVPDATAGGGG